LNSPLLPDFVEDSELIGVAELAFCDHEQNAVFGIEFEMERHGPLKPALVPRRSRRLGGVAPERLFCGHG
jgi:hypothetical protein